LEVVQLVDRTPCQGNSEDPLLGLRLRL